MSAAWERLLCWLIGHSWDAYRWSPPRCIHCGARYARGTHD